MVVQRDMPIPLRGSTSPDTKVHVDVISSNGKVAHAHGHADRHGHFELALPPLGIHTDPLTFRVHAGDQVIELTDVLVGDVWVCSGQSNMEFKVAESNNPEAELANTSIPHLRLLQIPKVYSATKQEHIDAEWQHADRTTAGSFSAVGFFFARQLRRDLHARGLGDIPIGLIGTYWGGTQAEAWTPLESLQSAGDTLANLVSRYHTESRNDLEIPQPYVDGDNLGEAKGWHEPDHDDSAWGLMNKPQSWQSYGHSHNGSMWFRKEITLGPNAPHQPATLSLGMCDDMDHTYINGVLVGRTGAETPAFWSVKRRYEVPQGLLREGRNVIAVRVFDQWGAGGMMGPADQMLLELQGNQADSPEFHPLAGEWKYHVETALPLRFPPGGQGIAPTTLYNAMVHPLTPRPIKGVLWYQGESNADRAEQYRTLLPTMIQSWRECFGVHFPFYIVQLANWKDRTAHPGDADWAELREAQDSAQLALPDVFLISAIDVGDPVDIHPTDKQTVAHRLADAALATAYRQDIPWRHPSLARATFQGNHVRIQLNDAQGLHIRGDRIEGFALAGDDRIWHWAQAHLEPSGEITLHSPNVPSPTAARYAWQDNPPSTLFNSRNLPLLPFRTDTYPGLTTGRR
jgi:sialate O-acetylesterase